MGLNVICPRCRRPLRVQDVAVAADRAVCGGEGGCGEEWTLADVMETRQADGALAKLVPQGCAVRLGAEGVEIVVRHGDRELMLPAWGAAVFMNVCVGVMWYGSWQQVVGPVLNPGPGAAGWGLAGPVGMLVYFVIIMGGGWLASRLMLSDALEASWGRTEVLVTKVELRVRERLGPLGRWRHVDRRGVKAVSWVALGPEGPPGERYCVFVNGTASERFGRWTGKRRSRWLAKTVRALVLPAKTGG